MTKLRPPDGRLFITVDKVYKKQKDVTVTHVGAGLQFEVGQKLCVTGKIEKIEVQGLDVYTVHERDVDFIYE
jgi:hypothetical protein